MKRFARICVILALVTLFCVGSLTVSAALDDPAVIYNGRTRTIEFQSLLPFGKNTEPDLFRDMKGMMPGDSISQSITVGAKNMDIDRVRLWLRAENPNEDYQKLMETYGHWVDFTVAIDDKEITGNLAEGVELGYFNSRGKDTVSVTLSIDPEAGNALQDLVAEVDWVFTAEIIPGTIGTPPISGDGDNMPWLTDKHINYIIGYEDDTVRPNSSITRAEVATIFYRLLTDEIREEWFSTESSFPDVTEDDWFYVAVCTLTNGGILNGYPDGSFLPNNYISRAELAAIISRFDPLYGEIEISESFKDVKHHWAEEEIEFAAARGYVVGYPDGKFRPDQAITRAETVTIVNRCLQRAVDAEGLLDDYLSWSDNHPGTWYYYEIIEAANYHDYDRSDRPGQNSAYCCENWAVLHKLIDWAYVERNWILIYTDQ